MTMHESLKTPMVCGAGLGAVFGFLAWMVINNSNSLLFAMP